MVYINSRGELTAKKPITEKIFAFFYGVFNLFLLFFKTLLEPLTGAQTPSSNNYRPGVNGANRSFYAGGAGSNKRKINGFGSSSASGPSAPPCAGSS